MQNNNYWLILKPHIYVDFKEDGILLYNTKDGGCIETREPEAIQLISDIYKSDNLGVVCLDENRQSQLHDFVKELMDKQMANIEKIRNEEDKPINLLPILNLQQDVEKLKKRDERLIGENIMNYLLELNIYLNNTCSVKCPNCIEYNRQFNCCTAIAYSSTNNLPIETIQKTFEQIKYSSIGQINILGGNILEYKDMYVLNEISRPFIDIIHCYIHYFNYKKNNYVDTAKLELIVNCPINSSKFNNIWKQIDKEKTTVHFIVENEKQYIEAERYISTFNIENITILPFYTGNNLNFFFENVFLKRDDIFSTVIKMREIFRNQKLNSNFFGTITILPTGEVKANINSEKLGNIQNDKILDIIYKEMNINTAWRKVRNEKPCNSCLYQYLCPPPSNYEHAIGKYNLCHVI
jgi:pseudo-rSAM protein